MAQIPWRFKEECKINLTKNCEICGALIPVEPYEGKMLLKLSVDKLVETPLKQSLQKSLQKKLVEKTCIINVDGEYYVRKIPKKYSLQKTEVEDEK